MKVLKVIQTFLLGLIGSMSLFMTLSIIFDLFGVREKEGNYMLFIVYANLICSVLYLLAALMSWIKPKISLIALLFACLILIVAFVELFVHIKKGGVYEQRTIYAMAFRTSFTLLMTFISLKIYKNKN